MLLSCFRTKMSVPVRILDHRQPLAFARDDLKVAALRVEVYAGEGLDLAVPLDCGQIESHPGGNCIKIGLPGKSILRCYFQEIRTS